MGDVTREIRDAAACELLINSTELPKGPYCPGTFDSWTCWPPTPANRTAYASCPDFVPGFSGDVLAHKECLANGSWFKHPDTGLVWSNYTTCVRSEDDRSGIVATYEAGYCISLVALLLSLGILNYFKSLRCARITVHKNLFTSFAINNALWLLWFGAVLDRPDVIPENPVWCRILHCVLQYVLLTNYTWMLCEGLYLHTVLVSAFVSETRLLRALLAGGWLLPALATAVYAGLRAGSEDDLLCWMEESSHRSVLLVVVAGSVMLNLIFLCNIVRVLCTKLRAAPALHSPRPSATALQAFRATFLLVPLLGLQYLLTPFRPPPQHPWERVYEYVSAVTASLQGLCVATLFCFCNGEVLAQLRRRWRALTFRPRANSCTATTVSPVCLQFVRSSAPHPGEEKV